MSEKVYRYEPDVVSPPGVTLLETIEALGLSQSDLAERMGRPVKTINEIISGKAAITSDTALQLEMVLGVPASFWRNRESHYREFLARDKERSHLASDASLLKRVPEAAMVKAGWIEKARGPVERTRAVLRFFGVASAQAWEQVSVSQATLFGMPEAGLRANHGNLTAWLRKGEVEGNRIECSSFDSGLFRETLRATHEFTKERPATYTPKLQNACAAAGVAVVLVPGLPLPDGKPGPSNKTKQTARRVVGATRWLGPNKGLIQLNPMGLQTEDDFWLAFLHQAGHLLLHGKRRGFLEGASIFGGLGGGEAPEEDEANRFAFNLFVPPIEYRQLIAGFGEVGEGGAVAEEAILRFAEKIGVAPGIVVGRLEREGRLSAGGMDGLKKRL